MKIHLRQIPVEGLHLEGVEEGDLLDIQEPGVGPMGPIHTRWMSASRKTASSRAASWKPRSPSGASAAWRLSSSPSGWIISPCRWSWAARKPWT